MCGRKEAERRPDMKPSRCLAALLALSLPNGLVVLLALSLSNGLVAAPPALAAAEKARPAIPSLAALVRGLAARDFVPLKGRRVAWNTAAVAKANAWLEDNLPGRQLTLEAEVLSIDGMVLLVDAGPVSLVNPTGLFDCKAVQAEIAGDPKKTAAKLARLNPRKTTRQECRPGKFTKIIHAGSMVVVRGTVEEVRLAIHPDALDTQYSDLAIRLKDSRVRIVQIRGEQGGMEARRKRIWRRR